MIFPKKPRYLFFDVGYTLVNEDEVWRCRCREQAEMPDAREKGVTETMLYEAVCQASREYLSPYKTAVKRLGLEKCAPYRGEKESPYPEAAGVLKALKERYCLGVIANQEEGLERRLTAFGLMPHLTLVFSSWDSGIAKPDVRLYLAALQKAGCAPGEAVMIGDRLDNDIAPAKKLGMGTVWLRRGFGGLQTPRDEYSTPDAAIDSLEELLTIL